MVKKLLIRMAIAVARDPKNAAKIILYIAALIAGMFVLIASIAFGMIASFKGSNKQIDDDFNVEEEQIYKDIDAVYREFESEMQAKMSAREAEIIAEHTETIQTDE